MDDPFNLQRFIEAQQPVFETACAELKAGRKRTHWMWFIFPQIEGLGHSAMARKFAIASLDEAKAYLAHPVLGPRLRECSRLVADLDGRTIGAIFPYPDDLKFHSSVSLFAYVAPDEPVFNACLKKYFSGAPDAATLDRIR